MALTGAKKTVQLDPSARRRVRVVVAAAQDRPTVLRDPIIRSKAAKHRETENAMRPPFKEAGKVAQRLDLVYKDMNVERPDKFMEAVFEPMLFDESFDLTTHLNEVLSLVSSPPALPTGHHSVFYLATAYCVAATRASAIGDIESAWSHVVEATYWSAVALAGSKSAGLTAAMLEPLQRMRAGASEGGRQSARTRQKATRVPSREKLQEDRIQLLAHGRSKREIASILARRYQVTPDYIRKLLARSEQMRD